MQHANNQCYEMHVAVKGNRSTRPVYQPANQINSPQYHGLSIGKSSVRDHRGPSAHHSSAVHSYPVDTTPMIALYWCTTHMLTSSNVARVINQICQGPIYFSWFNSRSRDFPEMLKSITGTQYLSSIQLHNHVNPTARSILRSYTSTQELTTKNRAQTTRNSHPKAQKKRRQNLLNETSNSRTSRAFGISQLVAPSFQTSINGKSKSQGVQRHQERQKQRLESTGNGD
ncbi:hypothetical protein F511_33859 [Dorcoceras hygrometricum]|uniref:Uncharacterized protein n=1 Tax=Dorcoceras hygrometricum TaxID=472368 RepID=A0A2Z7DD16_9LAMI|nr:hypothetical protein F511_33859 [Dorcoceras hygrometricum]